ncbi:MAG: zinc-ribbon domain-containing protein [Firmicutes bacterium]|nr:zinc-ribbon domain-containing protein [Bacillota bacterium]
MAKETLTICKSCGAQIAKSAKTCPNCGAKNKKPIYKRPWFIILAIIVVIGIIGGAIGGGDDSAPADDQSAQVEQDKGGDTAKAKKETEAKIEYESVTADEMMDDLDANAASAKDKYEDKYFAISGKLGTIDSDGQYFDVMPDDEFAFLGVTCNITDDNQLDTIKGMSKDQALTVKGKVTDVGEVLGYYVDIDSIE